MTTGPLTAADLDNLRHALGAVPPRRRSAWGFRNYFRAGASDVPSMERLVAAGFVWKDGTAGADGDVVYHATIEGCRAVGMTPREIARVDPEPAPGPPPPPAEPPPKHPQHEKLAALERERAAVQGFLDFLSDKRFLLAGYHEHGPDCYEDGHGNLTCTASTTRLAASNPSKAELIAEYLGIDLKEFELEKRAMLDDIRKAAGA
jgi:hypothetical protein